MVVIARIPNPNAEPAGYTTASEVATMDFVSERPGLFLWSLLTWVGYRLELYYKFYCQKSLLGILV